MRPSGSMRCRRARRRPPSAPPAPCSPAAAAVSRWRPSPWGLLLTTGPSAPPPASRRSHRRRLGRRRGCRRLRRGAGSRPGLTLPFARGTRYGAMVRSPWPAPRRPTEDTPVGPPPDWARTPPDRCPLAVSVPPGIPERGSVAAVRPPRCCRQVQIRRRVGAPSPRSGTASARSANRSRCCFATSSVLPRSSRLRRPGYQVT